LRCPQLRIAVSVEALSLYGLLCFSFVRTPLWHKGTTFI
jgi:hypothetical protein